VFEDRFGRMQMRIHVAMLGTRTANGLTLAETLTFEDGTRDDRVWQLVRTGSNRFAGTTPDCIGTALGEIDETGVTMTYLFRLRVGERTIPVRMEDKLYRLSERVLLNRAVMRKLGVRLGELTLVFEKPAAAALPLAALSAAAG
jgi:hypothetical protein